MEEVKEDPTGAMTEEVVETEEMTDAVAVVVIAGMADTVDVANNPGCHPEQRETL